MWNCAAADVEYCCSLLTVIQIRKCDDDLFIYFFFHLKQVWTCLNLKKLVFKVGLLEWSWIYNTLSLFWRKYFATLFSKNQWCNIYFIENITSSLKSPILRLSSFSMFPQLFSVVSKHFLYFQFSHLWFSFRILFIIPFYYFAITAFIALYQVYDFSDNYQFLSIVCNAIFIYSKFFERNLNYIY